MTENMFDTWGVTPQEAVLDLIYEAVKGSDYVPEIFGVTEKRPVAQLWIRDPDGTCWQITATVHPHLEDK